MKWDRVLIGRELGMDSRTVGKRLADADLDEKKHFSTKEVFAAMQGDLSAERIRETRERADKLALENAEKRRELVNVHELAPKLAKFLSATRQSILATTHIEDDDKDKLLRDLNGMLEIALCAPESIADASASLSGK